MEPVLPGRWDLLVLRASLDRLGLRGLSVPLGLQVPSGLWGLQGRLGLQGLMA
ncbi:MAG: hypothetical protein IT299_12165 [Dehalococcoidia bacterium]|nr:hypothetical protein [Dehalococcoidia bacterium]